MLEALTYQEMLDDIVKNSERYGIEQDVIGVLITRPSLETGQNILKNLEYYHFRTGKTINFYLPGYGAYWYDAYPDGQVVAKIDGAQWYFSNEMFVRFIEELERYSKWKYSGESELLLIPYSKRRISYEEVMIFHLDRMLRDNVIFSIHEFFEQLFRLCKDKETMNEIQNSFRLDKARQIVSNHVFKKVSGELGEIFVKGRHFCVKNLEK